MTQILEDVTDAVLAKLVARWFDWRDGKEYPSRKSIEPTELGSALPFVWLCEFDTEIGCYRYRLVGEAVNTLYGHGLRGRYLKDFLSPATADLLRRRLNECLTTGTLVYTFGPQTLHDKRNVIIHRLFLPMTGNTDRPDTILGCTKVTEHLIGAERDNPQTRETFYSADGARVKDGNAALTMFSTEMGF